MDDDEKETAVFWDEQSRLPLWKRDPAWWWSVGFSNTVWTLFTAGMAFAVVKAIVDAI